MLGAWTELAGLWAMERKVKMKHWTLAAALGLAMLFCHVGTALAQTTRSFCVQLGFFDERNRCPGDDIYPTAGVRDAPCNRHGLSYSWGVEFELWDRDDDSADDYIGTWRADPNWWGPGETCGTFQWTDTADHPDLYIKMFPRGSGRGSYIYAKQNVGTALNQNWQNYPSSSTRNLPDGVHWNCIYVGSQDGDQCVIGPGFVFVPSNTPTSEINGVYAALDSAFRAQRTYPVGAVNSTSSIWFFVDELSQFPDNDQCDRACAVSRTAVRLPLDGDVFLDGDRVAHEMGHVFQMSEFGRDDLRDVCTGSDNNWDIASPAASDSCATTEGFASYVGALAWYLPTVATVQPRYAGRDMETSTHIDQGSCAGNRRIPGQVAKGFWDLDDVNNELGTGPSFGYDDVSNSLTQTVLNNWDTFPPGTANHEDFESDADGVNQWDYVWNTWGGDGGLVWGPASNYETLLSHNCTGNQTVN
jgi:hypothetical protein